MVTRCCVKGCSEQYNPSKKFVKIPAVHKQLSKPLQKILESRRQAWISVLIKHSNIRLEKVDVYRICGKHFISGKPSHFLETDNPDWVPSVFHSKNSINQQINVQRYERRKNRETIAIANSKNQQQHLCEVVLSNETNLTNNEASLEVIEATVEDIVQTSPGSIESTSQTIDSADKQSRSKSDIDVSVLQKEIAQLRIKTTELEIEVKQLRNENVELQTEIKDIRQANSELLKERAVILLDKAAFENKSSTSKDKIKYYTGLPNLEAIELILEQIDPALSEVKSKKLSNFQKLILTLFKLRFNITFEGLAYRFNITEIKASYIFKEVILILDCTFDGIVHWPSRDLIAASMPECFEKAFDRKIMLLIACFEIPTESPSLLDSKSTMYSSNKSTCTAKYLIGITPQGSIAFISKGWGGRTSDKHITETCGLLDLVKQGDWILADREFTVHDEVARRGAKLLTPSLTEGLKQMHPTQIEQSRKISSVREHLERVIGNLRIKYKIIKNRVPISLMNTNYDSRNFLDYIVRVCCILTNLCERV